MQIHTISNLGFLQGKITKIGIVFAYELYIIFQMRSVPDFVSTLENYLWTSFKENFRIHFIFLSKIQGT